MSPLTSIILTDVLYIYICCFVTKNNVFLLVVS